MKPIIPFALLGALLTVGTASAVATKPVGYVTETATAGQFSLIGLTLHESSAVQSTVESVAGSVVTDSSVDFSVALGGGPYLFEILSGTLSGSVISVVSSTATTVTLAQDPSADLAPGDSYRIRPAATISGLFGSANEAGLNPSTDGGTAGADLVYLPQSDGSFTIVFYYNDGSAEGWYDTDFNDAANIPVTYTNSFFFYRAPGTDLTLTVTGEVKTEDSSFTVGSGFTFASSVSPVGSTFSSTGLSDYLLPSTDGSTAGADVIWMPNGSGYTGYIYYNDGSAEGWYDLDFNDATNEPLKSGFYIASGSGSDRQFLMTTPSFYGTL